MNVCNKYRKSKKTKISYIFKKTLSLSTVYSKCRLEDEKIFKEKESLEILKILGVITNIEEYQKTDNHVWRKYIIISEENITQEFRLKNMYETRN